MNGTKGNNGIKFFLCIKDSRPPYYVSNTFVNVAFITSFVNSWTNGGTYTNVGLFVYGKIYHTLEYNEDYVIDDNGASVSLLGTEEYLEPFELEIDELTQKVLRNKKNDSITIYPVRFDKETRNTEYLLNVTAKKRNGGFITTTAVSNSIYDGLKVCYYNLRRRNGSFSSIYRAIHCNQYPYYGMLSWNAYKIS